jgi:hypothetical protein
LWGVTEVHCGQDDPVFEFHAVDFYRGKQIGEFHSFAPVGLFKMYHRPSVKDIPVQYARPAESLVEGPQGGFIS